MLKVNPTLLNIMDQKHTSIIIMYLQNMRELQSTLFCISARSKFVQYKTFTESYRLLALEYMRVLEFLNFERYTIKYFQIL